MPVKIRLMRIGAKKRPFYRVVAVDEQRKRTGGYLELLGTYNPLTSPKEIILKQERIDHWLKVGAVPSDGFLRMTGKAPQRPPRKPKKEPKAPAPTVAPAKEEVEALEGKEGLEEKPLEEAAVGESEERVVENTGEPVEENGDIAQANDETSSPEETQPTENSPLEEKTEQPETEEENTEKS